VSTNYTGFLNGDFYSYTGVKVVANSEECNLEWESRYCGRLFEQFGHSRIDNNSTTAATILKIEIGSHYK
jgi:hypothetical protein